MTEDAQVRHKRRRLLWLGLAAAAVLLAILVAAPLVSLNRYKSRITQLMSASLGRPVRLSAVELRMLPRPGFVLSNLIVEEDPAYGAEPVLQASTVTASMRLLPLMTGKLEISSISVDDATLNLVRVAAGQWNLDPLFRTAAAKAGVGGAAGQHRAVPLPYLEATNSRINIKSGTEKLPYSLLDTDLSFWQEEPGEWRIRLRGQPARTDVIVQGADTGVVRLEGSVHRAAELRQMPVHLDLDWRDAQLGQLARLMTGSDPGWRGDLTAELHLDGTPEAAQIKTRLRAAGVHRAEFAPAAPMDFDANCSLVYHYSTHAVNGLVCDSPLGDGHVRLAGEMPADGAPKKFLIEVNKIPVAAGLDALRTVRSGFGPGLEASGSVSGKISYAEGGLDTQKTSPANTGSAHGDAIRGVKGHANGLHGPQTGPLTGTLTVEGFRLSGDGLRDPVLIPKLTLEPATLPQQGQPSTGVQPAAGSPAFAAIVSVPAGTVAPLIVTTRLNLAGYQVTVHGQASMARAKELSHLVGMGDAGTLDALAGDAVTVDLSADGPWMVSPRLPLAGVATVSNPPGDAGSTFAGTVPADRLAGTVTLHNANWKSDYLANHVEIQQATLHLDNAGAGDHSGFHWDPVIFSYGPVRGTASLTLPTGCAPGQHCPTRFAVQFGVLDAAALQAAILGAHQKGTLLSELIERLSPSSPAPAWPELEGTVKADSLILGPETLEQPSATLHILNSAAEITAFDAGMLGGRVHGSGTVSTGDASHTRPAYTLTGTFEKLNPAAVGELLGQHWSGGALNADGRVELSGFTGQDLASSAKGTLHFEWRRGTMAHGTGAQDDPAGRFERWTGDAEIASGKAALTESQMLEGGRTRRVEGYVQLDLPAKFMFSGTKDRPAKH